MKGCSFRVRKRTGQLNGAQAFAVPGVKILVTGKGKPRGDAAVGAAEPTVGGNRERVAVLEAAAVAGEEIEDGVGPIEGQVAPEISLRGDH